MFIKIIILLLLLCWNAEAGDISKAHTYITGEVLTAPNLNNSFDEIINEVNDLDGDNFASNVAITSSGNMTFSGTTSLTGNFSATGTTNTIGNGGTDTLTLNTPSGITFTPAATWTFSANQTVSGTWADLGTATTIDINGGTIDGTTIGGSTAAAGTFTTLTATTLGGALNLNSQALTNANIDSGNIDGTAIGSSSQSTGHFSTLKVGTTNQGDVLYDNGTSIVRLTPGTSGQLLKTQGAAANPTWTDDKYSPLLLAQNVGGESNSTSWTEVGARGIFKKLPHITDIKVYGYTKNSVGGYTMEGKISIGGLEITGLDSTSTTITRSSNTKDISSLSNGTEYDVIYYVKSNSGSNTATFRDVLIFLNN